MKLGFVSDIHEDAVHLQVAFRQMESLCDEVICLGDILGFAPDFYTYKPDASACLALIRSQCSHIVAGNHDLFAAERIPEQCNLFDFPSNWYSLPFGQRKKLAGKRIWLYQNEQKALLNDEEREFLHSLPEYKKVETKGVSIMLSHFLHPDLSGSGTLKPCSKAMVDSHLHFMASHDCTMSFCGHTHTEGLWFARPLPGRFAWLKLPVRQISFGDSVDASEPCFFSIPAIARSARRSGFAVYDTCNRSMTAYPL